MRISHGVGDFRGWLRLLLATAFVFSLQFLISPTTRAQDPAVDPGLLPFLDVFSTTPLLDGNESGLKSIGERASDYLKGHPDSAASDAGRDLKSRIAKATNYYEMKKKFEDCHAGSDLKLDSRIEEIAVTLSPANLCGCEPKVDPFHEIFESVRYSNMQDAIVGHSMINALNKYFDVEMRYGNRDASGIIPKLCAGGCSSQVRDQLQKRLAALEQNPPAKEDGSNVIYGLSNSLYKINDDLYKVQVQPQHKIAAVADAFSKPLNTLNMDRPNITDADRKTFDQYANSYMKLLSSPDGSLLNTKVMRDCTGSYRDLDHDLKLDFPFAYTYHLEPYKTVSQCVEDDLKKGNFKYGDGIDVFNAAVAEMKKSIEDETTHLGKMEAAKSKQEQGDPIHHARAAKKSLPDLEELVESDPAAVAQYLLDNPDETTEICKIIKQAQIDRKKSAKRREVAIYSAGILMGAAAIASGGAGAALYIFEGAAIGGEAATVAAITTFGAYSSMTAAFGGIAYTGARWDGALAAGDEATLLQNAFFSGNSDVQGGVDAQKALTNYYSVRNQAIVSTLLTPLDVKALVDGVGAIKGAEALKEAAAVDNLTSEIAEANDLNSDGKLSEAFQKMRDPAVEGQTNTSKVMQALFGQTSEALRIKVLNAMKDWNGAKLKALAEAALKGSAKCQ